MNANLQVPETLPNAQGGQVFVKFGPRESLMGILSGPTDGETVLLLPSAGLQPRSGPFRLHTLLAKRLSEQGIRTFRYDLPGVGEAPRLSDCDAVQATNSAMDQLVALGCRYFAIGGICSAADTGWRVAVADKRVSAIVMLDGVSFTGPWFHYARTINRLRRLPRDWRRMMQRIPSRIGNVEAIGSAEFRDWPSHGTMREQFADLVSRRVKMLWIYSGGYTDRFLHRRQFRWGFGSPARSPDVALHYWPDCDHTYFGHAQRERLIGVVQAWMVDLDLTKSDSSGRG